MKKFNKEKALTKIKNDNNKYTYIKRLSISLACLILVMVIMLFAFGKYETNSPEYVLIKGRVGEFSTGDITLSYVVNGVAQDAPPAKGTGYKFKSASCTNAEGVWSKSEWGLMVKNITGKAKCNLEFETLTETQVDIYSAAADEVYVYDGDTKRILGTTDSTGKLENVTVDIDNVTFYSSVANDPDNLNNYYSKEIAITSQTTSVYVMPSSEDKMVYWYGYKGSNFEEANHTNGWASPGYNGWAGAQTYQTNYISFSRQTNSSGVYSGIGTANSVSGNSLNAIVKLSNTSNTHLIILYAGDSKSMPNLAVNQDKSANPQAVLTLQRMTWDISQLGSVYCFHGNIHINNQYNSYAMWIE